MSTNVDCGLEDENCAIQRSLNEFGTFSERDIQGLHDTVRFNTVGCYEKLLEIQKGGTGNDSGKIAGDVLNDLTMRENPDPVFKRFASENADKIAEVRDLAASDQEFIRAITFTAFSMIYLKAARGDSDAESHRASLLAHLRKKNFLFDAVEIPSVKSCLQFSHEFCTKYVPEYASTSSKSTGSGASGSGCAVALLLIPALSLLCVLACEKAGA